MKKSVKNQLDALNSELGLLFRDLKKFSDEDLNWKPGEGKWSVLQIMEHLILAELISQKYLEKKLSFNPELKNTNLMSAMRSIFITFYLNSPLKVKAPAAVGETLPEQSTFWELVKQWKQNREDLETYLNTLPPETFKKQVYKHPLGGRMSIGNMMTFHKNHFHRHRKQIFKILKNFKY